MRNCGYNVITFDIKRLFIPSLKQTSDISLKLDSVIVRNIYNSSYNASLCVKYCWYWYLLCSRTKKKHPDEKFGFKTVLPIILNRIKGILSTVIPMIIISFLSLYLGIHKKKQFVNQDKSVLTALTYSSTLASKLLTLIHCTKLHVTIVSAITQTTLVMTDWIRLA